MSTLQPRCKQQYWLTPTPDNLQSAAVLVKPQADLDMFALRKSERAVSTIGSPEFKKLICAQRGNELTGQVCHGSRLPQFQPTVDPPHVAHPLNAEEPSLRIEEDEAQHRRIAGEALLFGLQPLSEARSRQSKRLQLVE